VAGVKAMKNALKTLTEICRESVQDALISHPDEPAAMLAAQLADELDTEAFHDLARHLVTAFFLRLIRAQRNKQKKAERAQMLLPGFEYLPVEIEVFQRSVPLAAATMRQVKEYVRLLVKEHRERVKTDPQLNQARALLALMEKHATSNERITVQEVLRQAGPAPSERGA
jgi:hypothetical protein